MIDDTHDPALVSWVPSAQVEGTDFPVQNLPFGVFRTSGATSATPPRVGVAIGDQVLDLSACRTHGLLTGSLGDLAEACLAPSLNPLMALGRPAARALRRAASEWLRATSDGTSSWRARIAPCLVPQTDVVMELPAAIGDYTDFYASIFHATNVGSMLRPDEPLLPNYKHVPIGYHGRASSVVVSGTPVVRPSGQMKPEGRSEPVFGPSRRLDYEAELGFLVAGSNRLGEAVPIDEAEDRVFGVCLLNDWSARDVQAWEYQPLGPFLAKSFATSISPWVVTLDALAPFRAPAFSRPDGDPAPLPYLSSAHDAAYGALDIQLEVAMLTAGMRAAGVAPQVVSRSRARHLYWTPAQLIAHHTSNGCNLRPGDLLGSGTVSGPTRESRGCLLELTWRGREPLTLPGGETRRFLEDGDDVILRGACVREGAARIGLGECRGLILPAVTGEAAGPKRAG